MIIVLMGVSGSGKTSVGERLAESLSYAFLDGDDLHPEANRRKMAEGRPLHEEDRRPWLEAIRAWIERRESSGGHAIVACSALKEDYRRRISRGVGDPTFVYLRGSQDLIAKRLRDRKDHFFDPDLLESQFAILEEPRDACVVDVHADLDVVVARVMRALDLSDSFASEDQGES